MCFEFSHSSIYPMLKAIVIFGFWELSFFKIAIGRSGNNWNPEGVTVSWTGQIIPSTIIFIPWILMHY